GVHERDVRLALAQPPLETQRRIEADVAAAHDEDPHGCVWGRAHRAAESTIRLEMTAGPRRRTAPGEDRIRAMFDDVAERYDLLNGVISLGMDRWWRRVAARAVADATAPAARVLDLGCGTGRLGALLTGRARVVGMDLSQAMLARAMDAAPPFAGLVQA